LQFVQGQLVQPTATSYFRHVPLRQSASLGQAVPHAPQFNGSLRVDTQTLPEPMGHFVVPVLQLLPLLLHEPARQISPEAHLLVQEPQ
jgi:hypothetical protein